MTGSVTYGFTYSYNLAGALLQETLSDGSVLNTTYDTANRVSGLTGKLSGATTSYVGKMSYWPFGPLAGYQYGNGMVRGTAYDSRMQPIEISDTQAGLAPIAAIAACQGGTTYTNQTAFLLDLQMFWGQSATQTTANNGVLWGILERNCGGTSPKTYTTGYNYWQSFNYDALNRLTVANDNGGGGSGAGWNRNYNFDTWGNMWVTNATGIALAGPTATTNVYYAANNQDSRWSYDAAGNMKSANGNSLNYNAENELTAAQGTYAYEGLSYDGLGRRVQKSISGGATTVYVYDVNGLAAEYVNGAWAKDYVADGVGDLVATENAAGGVCTTCYYSTDHLGSVRMVTDQNGQVQGRQDYLPFGEEVGANQANRTSQWGPVSDVTEKFTGQVRDSESGMDYFNARYFTATLGRFNSVDPGNAGASLGSSQSWNGYGYVMGNPMVNVDPSGMYADPTNPAPAPAPAPFPSGLSTTFAQECAAVIDGSEYGAGPATWSLCNQISSSFSNSFGQSGGSAATTVKQAPLPTSSLSATGTNGGQRPDWLNSITSIFGYDQRIKLPSCAALAFSTALDDLNPFSPGTFGAVKDLVGTTLLTSQLYYFNTAINHAAGRQLPYPNKSGIFRGFMQKSAKLGKAADDLGLLAVDVALFHGFVVEMLAMSHGECQ